MASSRERFLDKGKASNSRHYYLRLALRVNRNVSNTIHFYLYSAPDGIRVFIWRAAMGAAAHVVDRERDHVETPEYGDYEAVQDPYVGDALVNEFVLDTECHRVVIWKPAGAEILGSHSDVFLAVPSDGIQGHEKKNIGYGNIGPRQFRSIAAKQV